MANELTEFWGEPIYTYTRAQAIEDGVLVDLMQGKWEELVRNAGFRFPVAMTAEAFGKYVLLSEAAKRACNDELGRLWDVLWMLSQHIRRTKGRESQLLFSFLCVTDRIKPTRHTLKSVCGPNDDGSPCITIMLPEQD